MRRQPKAGVQPTGRNIPFRAGDKIGLTYHVYGVLGKGGFGIVLSVFDYETNQICALKTFRDELLADPGARETFKREANKWVNLGNHPFVLAARSVRDISSRLFVKMDFVPPDEEGRVSLADHLAVKSQPLGLERILEWAIQFCLAMEHAQKHGIQCHRDIKPQNILIAPGMILKLSDFGLALVGEANVTRRVSSDSTAPNGHRGLSMFSLDGRQLCGTPGYIAPEIFRGEAATTRSDIYSFGLVLWQMAAMNVVPPFAEEAGDDLDAYLKKVYERQMTSSVPSTGHPIDAIIERCLRKDPSERFGSFTEVRGELEALLWQHAGRKIELPGPEEQTASSCYERAISLESVGRHEDCLAALDQAMALKPDDLDMLITRGACLGSLRRYEEALDCYDRALAIEPKNERANFNKGIVLDMLGRPAESLAHYSAAVAQRPTYYQAWAAKGRALALLGKNKEALACYERSLEIYPRDALIWNGKAAVLGKLGRKEEELACYDQALAINPTYTTAWFNKSIAFSHMSRHEDALRCCETCIELNPAMVSAWIEKGRILYVLERDDEAMTCFEEALKIDPNCGTAWYRKSAIEENRGNFREAGRCLLTFIQLATPQEKSYVADARTRLANLEKKLAA